MIAQIVCIDVAAVTVHCHSVLPEQWSEGSIKVKLHHLFFDFSRWRPPPSSIFWNFKFSTVGRLKRSNCVTAPNFVEIGQTVAEMMIFRFFQNGGSPPSWICYARSQTNHEGHLVHDLYHCEKFGWNRCSSFDDMHVFRFRKFGLKTPIHPWRGSHINETPKGTSFCESVSFDPSCAKICRRVWYVGEFPKTRYK